MPIYDVLTIIQPGGNDIKFVRKSSGILFKDSLNAKTLYKSSNNDPDITLVDLINKFQSKQIRTLNENLDSVLVDINQLKTAAGINLGGKRKTKKRRKGRRHRKTRRSSKRMR